MPSPLTRWNRCDCAGAAHHAPMPPRAGVNYRDYARRSSQAKRVHYAGSHSGRLMTSAQHLRSIACRYQDFASRWYRNQEEQLKIREIYSWHSASEIDFVNRKFWEWCAIAQVLDERGKLHVGSQGLGFAVGTEPLSAFFASRGCDILATDLAAEDSSPGWIERNEHASSLNNLFYPQLVDQGIFGERVS